MGWNRNYPDDDDADSSGSTELFTAEWTGTAWSRLTDAIWPSNTVPSLSDDGSVATQSWAQPRRDLVPFDEVYAARWADTVSPPVVPATNPDDNVSTMTVSNADGSASLVLWHQFEDLDGDPETITRSRPYGSLWREGSWRPAEVLSTNERGSEYATNAVVSPDGLRATVSLYYNIEADGLGTRLVAYE